MQIMATVGMRMAEQDMCRVFTDKKGRGCE
jgi:hypothetical protein